MYESPTRADARPSGASHTMNALLDGARIVVETDMVARGKDVGASSGHQHPDPPTEARLEAEARSAARRYLSRPYDPDHNQSDRMYRDEYDRNLKLREDREAQLQHAEVALRDQRARTAQVPSAGPRPEINGLVLLFGVVGIALSVGLALHDAIFTRWFPDPVQATAASALAGLVLGAIPSTGMLFSATHGEEPTRLEGAVGFALGIAFGAAVYGLRVWTADGDVWNTIAWALALMEIVTVLVVKLYAVSLHREYRGWSRRDRDRRVAESEEQTRAALVDELRQHLQVLHDKAEAHRKRAAEAEDLQVLVPHLEAAAIAAVLKGYHEAVAANRAHVIGAVHPPRVG